ncbi:DUF2141 domain-containing protein [Novosphingobium lentum]|uniref:DUF2141 domain-containing protein n=1 Tax=Novosphingobium lentum TaxID=145287 RepID=UPI000836D0A9|nr:DUF2141 domain-containing protein [Novosphingobium lentum]
MSMFLALALAAQATSGSITVDVANVRNAKGRVRVDVCPQPQFLEDNCPFHADVPARAGTTTVVINGVPPGQYAIQAFHDENSNGEVDRALFGIPKEGVGFSRDARISFGPPKWADAVFSHDARPMAVRFGLRYFMGAKGPPTRAK